MLIQFKPEGGIAFFPGLNKASLIDTEKLSQEERTHIRELVEKCSFFNIHTTGGSVVKGADRKKYTISIEEGEKKNTVTLTDPVQDQHLADLIQVLNKISRSR